MPSAATILFPSEELPASNFSTVPATTEPYAICGLRCCLCGVPLAEKTPGARCLSCLRQEKQASSVLQTIENVFVKMCKGCGRYCAGGGSSGGTTTCNSSGSSKAAYVKCDWESKELLALCLKSLCSSQLNGGGGATAGGNINKQNRGVAPFAHSGASKYLQVNDITDAMFLYTEPHSRRIKIRVTVPAGVIQQRSPPAVSSEEVDHSEIQLSETRDIEFTVQTQQCPDCAREFTPHTWSYLVQVRAGKSRYNAQEASRRLFAQLETRLLKKTKCTAGIVANLVKHDLKAENGQADFFFRHKVHATAFIDGFLQRFFVVDKANMKESKTLVKFDEQNAVGKYKFTTCVCLAPILKWDLVAVVEPKLLAKHAIKIKHVGDLLGGSRGILLCVSANRAKLELLDPLSGRVYTAHDWRGFLTIADRTAMKNFTLMDIELSGEGGEWNSTKGYNDDDHDVAGTRNAEVDEEDDLSSGVLLEEEDVKIFENANWVDGAGGVGELPEPSKVVAAAVCKQAAAPANHQASASAADPSKLAMKGVNRCSVARTVDLGTTEDGNQVHGVLSPANLDVSDQCWGYDLRALVRSELEEMAEQKLTLPEVVLTYRVSAAATAGAC
eukprot:g14050.t1